jgi:hypothetical protein
MAPAFANTGPIHARNARDGRGEGHSPVAASYWVAAHRGCAERTATTHPGEHRQNGQLTGAPQIGQGEQPKPTGGVMSITGHRHG